MMEMALNDLTLVMNWSNRIEGLLKEHYQAKGNSLLELISSCEGRIPFDAQEKLRYIAAVRSEALEKSDYKLVNTGEFLITCKHCEKNLQPRSEKIIWCLVLLVILSATAGALWFYIENWSVIVGG